MRVIMPSLFLIGRILFGGFFLMMGINHFQNTRMLAHMAKQKGVPSPQFAVYISGLLLFLGGLGVILGIHPQIALILLIVFLLPVTFQMHAFWTVSEEETMSEMINFTKNMALVGAALMLLMLSLPWPLSV